MPNAIKLFLSVIYEFLYQAKVLIRLDRKNMLSTNTLTYYGVQKKFCYSGLWMFFSMHEINA
jgi:hypothetical protein